MTGETDLRTLIRDMQPRLNPGEYVFCQLQQDADRPEPEVLGWFREQEGVTIILPRTRAEELGLSYSFVGAWITLDVHSSLQAVGLTAAVTQALTGAGISCNIVAAYHHDHLFVPSSDAARALQVLRDLAASS
jgi:hypothetical protein